MNQAVAKFEPFWAFQKQRSENCVCLGVSDLWDTSQFQAHRGASAGRQARGEAGGGDSFGLHLKMSEFFLFIAFFEPKKVVTLSGLLFFIVFLSENVLDNPDFLWGLSTIKYY